MFKKISMLIIIMLSIISFASAITLVDNEDFESYYEFKDYSQGYYSMDDESQSDGVAENTNYIVGCGTSCIDSISFLIRDSIDFNNIDEIYLYLTSSVGTPEGNNFKIDVVWCETAVTSLGSVTDYSECSNTPETILENYPVSDKWGSVTGDSTKTLPLNKRINLQASKNYIFFFERVSGTATSEYYRIKIDANPTADMFRVVTVVPTVTTYSSVPKWELSTATDDMANLHEWSDGNFYCSASYPDTCRKITGGGEGYSGFSIESEGDNLYLNMYALNGSGSSYEAREIYWRHENVSLVSADLNYTIYYKFRVNDVYDFSKITSFQKLNALAGIWNYVDYGTQEYGALNIGGIITTSEDNYTRLRINYDFDRMKPENSLCEVNDGNWHNIVVHYLLNSTGYLEETDIYIDNELCMMYTNGEQQNTAFPLFTSPSSLRFFVQAMFDVDFDDLYIFDGIVEPSELSEEEGEAVSDLICPIANCLYYDDFNYDDGSNLVSQNYGGFPTQAIVYDSKLYFNSTFYPYLPEISYNLIDNVYDTITGVTQFRVNFSETPVELQEDYLVFFNTVQCEDTGTVFMWNVYLFQDLQWSLSNNRTVANIYYIEDGKLRLLGTFTIDNGDYFSVKDRYDLNNGVAYLDIIKEADVEDGFLPENTFSAELNFQCDKMISFEFGRRDVEHQSLDYFVGVDKKFYYGGKDDLTSDTLDFEYTNATTQANAIIKTEISEEVHNMAFTLGFKTEKTKLAFWFLLTFFFVAILLKSSAPSQAKTLGTSGIFIFMMIIGFYWKFINVVVFTFMIFVVSVIGALVYTRLLKDGGSTD